MSIQKRLKRREVRQAGRANNPNKQAKQANRAEKKAVKKESGIRGQIVKSMQSRQARKDLEFKNAPEQEKSYVLEREQAQQQAENTGINGLNQDQRNKAIAYIKNNNAEVEPEALNDDKILSAQAYLIRENNIKKRNSQDVINQQELRHGEEEETELPSFEDSEEELMEEEENTFSFNGSEVDYFDPQTVGTVYAAAKEGLETMRQNAFSKGKKFLGKTKAQYEAEQAKKERISKGIERDPSVINAVTKKAEEQVTKDTVEDYKPLIITVGFLLLITGYFLYKAK